MPELSYFVEKIGIELEKVGYPPVVSRVMGLLLFSEPHQQSFYQIQDFLKASKSAISYAINFLLNNGDIETVTFPGDRKRYFSIHPEKWISVIKKKVSQVTGAKELFLEMSNLRKFDNPELSTTFFEIYELYNKIDLELSKVIDNWNSGRKKIADLAEFYKLMNKSNKK